MVEAVVPSQRWKLLPTLSAPMPFHMALDELLFKRSVRMGAESSGPLLRFYAASEPAVTVGYSDDASGLAGGENGRSVCRRITGGGRVDHGKDFLFSLVANKADDASFRSVRNSYLKIHEAVKSALEAAGHAVTFYRCDENLPRGEECFRYPIATDLAVKGKKAAGGAQKRSCGQMLHQESILLPGLPFKPFEARLVKAFESVFEVQIQSADIDPVILLEAKHLSCQKMNSEKECDRVPVETI